MARPLRNGSGATGRLSRWLARQALGARLGTRRLRRRLHGGRPQPVVRNAGRIGRLRRSRSALLMYLPRAFTLPDDHPDLRAHQNLLCCRVMVSVLGELGYVVDVADRRDREFWPRRDYDLIISERLDWNGLDRLFAPDAIRVFLATSLHHRLHNRNVRRRHALLEGRGRPPVEIRRIYGETMPFVVSADALVGVGNGFTMGTWAEDFDGPIHPFDNFGFPATPSSLDGKEFESARRRFLFFASRSQMQKGLDLLLEVFPRHPELELYVCSEFAGEPDFCAAYERELYGTPNVHPIGTVPIDDTEYADLVRRCAYVIHPSCSDGQAGAVVQCMASGLIPVVTRETGVDVDGFGVELPGDDPGQIERIVVELAGRPPEWHEGQAAATRAAALGRHSVETFADRWREIVAEVVAAGRRRAP